LAAALDGWTYLKQLVVNIRRQLEESVTIDIVVITEKTCIQQKIQNNSNINSKITIMSSNHSPINDKSVLQLALHRKNFLGKHHKKKITSNPIIQSNILAPSVKFR